jgi:hypothetical protein
MHRIRHEEPNFYHFVYHERGRDVTRPTPLEQAYPWLTEG